MSSTRGQVQRAFTDDAATVDHDVDPRAGQQNSQSALAPADDDELDPRAGAAKNLRRHAEVSAPSVHTGNWNHESSPSEMKPESRMKQLVL